MRKIFISFFIIIALLLTIGIFQKKETEVMASETLFNMDEMLVSFWTGEVSYNESFLVTENEKGEIEPITLLYDIEKIISVKSATLLLTYTEGSDYTVEDGKLIINKNGSIPRLSYDEMHPVTGQAGFESTNGGYVLWKEGAWFHNKQIVVTYRHKADYSGYIPEGRGRLLPKTTEKLKNKQDLTVLVYGDSISEGGNSSGNSSINVSPYMPVYSVMFAKAIEAKYGVNVKLINESKGGMDSNWGLSNLRGGILNKYPEEKFDLIVIGFGMNDTTKDKDGLALNVSRIADGFMRYYKDAEAMIIATMLPNKEAKTFYGNQVEFYDGIIKKEKTGVVAVNVGGVHAGLLERKAYADMTGNNVNHANDFLARVYAQTLLKTLEVSDYGKTSETPDDSTGTDTSGSDTDTASSTGGETSVSDKNGCGGAITGISVISMLSLAVLTVYKKRY